MKRWIFWSFDRGSFQYDVLCALILIAIFAIPPALFNDRPDYMRIPESGVRRSESGDGNAIYTVKVEVGTETSVAEQAALAELQTSLERVESLDVLRSEAVYDTRGRLAAYAFWIR